MACCNFTSPSSLINRAAAASNRAFRTSVWSIAPALNWLSTFCCRRSAVSFSVRSKALLVPAVRNTSTVSRSAGGKVFGSTVPFHLVRIDEAALLGPASTKREYTSFHTINGWGGIALDTLIHELTHVWQYETAGAIYMPQALHAQATGGYDYGDLRGLHAARAAGLDILSFNREQQAQIVQDFFRIAQGSSPMMSSGTKADQALYAYFVKDVSSHKEPYLSSLSV